MQDLFLFAPRVGQRQSADAAPSTDESRTTSKPIAPSMWVCSRVSALLGNVLPGPGTLYREQDLRFLRRVQVGDKLKITVVCREKREAADRGVRHQGSKTSGGNLA